MRSEPSIPRNYKPLSPARGIALFDSLVALRPQALQAGIAEVVGQIGVPTLDGELGQFASESALTRLAQLNIRGERVFPVPSLVRARPTLLGYYRMLLGVSRKDFAQKYGYQRFLKAEDDGVLSTSTSRELPELCRVFAAALSELVDALHTFDERDLSDLALLTLGPTLQGRRNTEIGGQAGREVYERIMEIIGASQEYASATHVRLTNAARRQVEIDFGADPDVRINEIIANSREPRVAMEIKGGSDVSNAHNRAGEAEKSHLKARAVGYNERWTLIALRSGTGTPLDLSAESPSTTRFFDIRHIVAREGEDWPRFRSLLQAQIGLPTDE